MHPSQQNLRYSQIKENNPTPRQTALRPTKPEKLCIHWENGDKALFYYSYLIGVRLRLEGETNVMTLTFMGEQVVLKGYNLDLLFMDFVYQEPHVIEVRTPRYTLTETPGALYVIEAEIG
jgi:hypothetical protein